MWPVPRAFGLQFGLGQFPRLKLELNTFRQADLRRHQLRPFAGLRAGVAVHNLVEPNSLARGNRRQIGIPTRGPARLALTRYDDPCHHGQQSPCQCQQNRAEVRTHRIEPFLRLFGQKIVFDGQFFGVVDTVASQRQRASAARISRFVKRVLTSELPTGATRRFFVHVFLSCAPVAALPCTGESHPRSGLPLRHNEQHCRQAEVVVRRRRVGIPNRNVPALGVKAIPTASLPAARSTSVVHSSAGPPPAAARPPPAESLHHWTTPPHPLPARSAPMIRHQIRPPIWPR